MAISIDRKIHRISQAEFHKIDYQVTGLTYSIHNEIGRLLDECIYRDILANQCRAAGFKNVVTEEVIRVSYKDFCKKYFIDLLVEDSIIYELKTVSELNRNHEKQTLNYLFLTGLHYAKLINFRPLSVQKRFISTTLCPEDRYAFFTDDNYWIDLNEESLNLKELILALLQDWGAYLETNLFYEAICFFNGGEENILKDIKIKPGSSLCGKQKIHLLNENIAFKITAITKDIYNYENHLRRFIRITNLNAIQWINFNQNKIVFKTIQK